MLAANLVSSRLISALTGSTRQLHSPTVFDKMVQLTVTDLTGNRHLYRGKIGDNLIDVLLEHEEELSGEDDVIGLSPEGYGRREAHVYVPNEYLDALPPPVGDQLVALNEIAPDHTKNSRLASKIKLSKGLNDITVALGRIRPWRTL